MRETLSELRLVLTGAGQDEGGLPEGVDALGTCCSTSGSRLPPRVCARVPEPLRGVRAPAHRGDGLRLPGRGLPGGVAPEVVGDAAVLFDPHDPAAISGGILEWALASRRRALRAGPGRAATFTWDACARAHDAVYALAAA